MPSSSSASKGSSSSQIDGGCGSASRASADAPPLALAERAHRSRRAGWSTPSSDSAAPISPPRACARAACRGSAATRPPSGRPSAHWRARRRAGGGATPASAWRSGWPSHSTAPCRRRRQAGQQAQQAGLAAAVAAAQPDHRPGPQRQLERAKQRPLAALAAERGRGERRRPRVGTRGDGGSGRRGGRIHFGGGAEAARWGLDSVDGRGSRQQRRGTDKKTARDGLARLGLSLSSRVQT